MSRSLPVLKLWIPVVVWMALIFVASTDLMSTQRTSGRLAAIVRWIKPDVSDNTLRVIQIVVRKGAHLIEYAILAALLWIALSGTLQPGGSWSWRVAFLAWAGSTAYAAVDEWHQTLVPTRYGSPVDVAIDSVGAILGLSLIWAIGRWKKRW